MTRKNFLSLTFTLIGFVYTSYAQDYQKYMSFSYQEIDSLVMTFYQKGDYQECLLSMQSARANAQADFGEQDSTFAEYTTNVSFFYSKIGAYDKAILLSKQAINVQEKIMGREHSSYTNSLSNLATLHFKMGNVEKALPIFQQIVKIEEKTLGKEHPEFAISLSNLARLHQELGDYDKALALYLELIKIREKTLGKEHHKFASTLNNLGYLYSEIGDLEQALPLYIQAKDIIGKVFGEEHPNVATALNNLAVLYTKMGDWDKALPLYIQAKDIIGKALGEEHPDFAIALNNLANFYQQLGNNNKSLKLQKQALDIEGKQLGKEHPQYATSLNNLAELYVRMNKYEEALPLLIQAVGIQKRNFGEEHPEVAGALNNLAYLYADMDKNAQALLLYTEAIKIIEKTLGKEHPQYAMSIGNLAELHIGMNNYNQSWSVLLKGIEALTQLRMSANVNQAWADSLYQVKYVSIQHIEKMVAILDYTYDLLEKDTTVGSSSQKQIVLADLALQFLTKLQNKVSNENDKLRFLEKSNAWLVKSLKKLNPTEQPSKAFNLSDGYKSVLLLRATKAENTYRLGELPDSLILQDKKRLKKQSELQAKLLEKRPKSEKDSLRNQLISVNEDIDDFLLLVKEKYPKYHKLKYQQIKTKAKDIQKLLDDKTALLEYVVTDSVLHIFYLDKNIIEWEQSLVSSKKLNGNIQEFHDALSNYPLIVKDSEEAYSQYIQKAHWFYQKLLKPVLKGKVNINNLIVITDGKLGHLPFETLLVEQAPQKITAYNKLHYLVNDYTISYNYSATLWKENIEAPTSKNNGQILGMAANYDIKLDSSIMGERLPTDQWIRSMLKVLPAARKEVETLQEEFEGFFAFDTLASEKTIKKMASEYAIIHLAMHGILDNKRPVLSSLAFTEDSDSLESNFWQAHEISKMQLNADLVVLSACETGFGKFERGNGIASLARAFMYAGAPSLIVSLWQVNDEASSKIMKNLYENLADNIPKDKALQQAKIQYIREAKGIAAHPAFWSPFIQMGKTKPVSIARKGESYGLWIGIGIGLLALLGGASVIRARRKRKEVA